MTYDYGLREYEYDIPGVKVQVVFIGRYEYEYVEHHHVPTSYIVRVQVRYICASKNECVPTRLKIPSTTMHAETWGR